MAQATTQGPKLPAGYPGVRRDVPRMVGANMLHRHVWRRRLTGRPARRPRAIHASTRLRRFRVNQAGDVGFFVEGLAEQEFSVGRRISGIGAALPVDIEALDPDADLTAVSKAYPMTARGTVARGRSRLVNGGRVAAQFQRQTQEGGGLAERRATAGLPVKVIIARRGVAKRSPNPASSPVTTLSAPGG